jgi:hypothetical protein
MHQHTLTFDPYLAEGGCAYRLVHEVHKSTSAKLTQLRASAWFDGSLEQLSHIPSNRSYFTDVCRPSGGQRALQMAKLHLNRSLIHFGNNITPPLSPHPRHDLNTLELVNHFSSFDAPATSKAYHELVFSRTRGLVLPFQRLDSFYV